jgi:hypothetical protein
MTTSAHTPTGSDLDGAVKPAAATAGIVNR